MAMVSAAAPAARVRILGPALLAGGLTACVAVFLAPLGAYVVRDVLHFGCERLPLDGEGMGDWACPDGIAYAIPAFLAIGGAAGVSFVAFLLRGLRRASKKERDRVIRTLAWCGAAPLILLLPFSVWLLAGDKEAFPTGVSGLLTGVLATLPLLTVARDARLFIAACVATTAAAVSVCAAAIVLTPVMALCGGLLCTAALAKAVGEGLGRRPGPLGG